MGCPHRSRVQYLEQVDRRVEVNLVVRLDQCLAESFEIRLPVEPLPEFDAVADRIHRRDAEWFEVESRSRLDGLGDCVDVDRCHGDVRPHRYAGRLQQANALGELLEPTPDTLSFVDVGRPVEADLHRVGGGEQVTEPLVVRHQFAVRQQFDPGVALGESANEWPQVLGQQWLTAGEGDDLGTFTGDLVGDCQFPVA